MRVSITMRKWYLFLIFSIVCIILSILPTHYFLPRMENYSGNYDLGPGNSNGQSIYLFYGTTFVLDISVQGANKDIYFYITDQEGNHIFEAGTVYDGYHLEIIHYKSLIDRYTFHFDNGMSLLSHKIVDYTLQVFPYPIIFIVAAITLIIITIVLIFKEEKVMEKLMNKLHREKEPTENTCEYCDTVYSKSLHKCPNCGAFRKKLEK